MKTLALDLGSSSVRAAVLRNGRICSPIRRCPFATCFSQSRTEVDAADVLSALRTVIAQLGLIAKSVDVIAIANMAPSWLAMDAQGRPLTPIVTHQDRRSVEMACELERRLGADRIMRISGNRPFPGGISSTTLAWFLRHEPARMRKAELVGHLNTYLHRIMTGARVTDPSNASFMGLYRTLELSGWSTELIEAVGVSRSLLPEVLDSDCIGGLITREASRLLGLRQGTPMMVGCMDGSAAMLLAGAEPGQMMDISGSTDVLALCTNRPRPHPRLLTRALGIGRRWLSVSTLAAAGSALTWAAGQLFADLPPRQFWLLVRRLARCPAKSPVRFDPYLAGDRMSIEQRWGAFHGLSLGTTREDMLSAIIEALAQASAVRIQLLKKQGVAIRRSVMVSGGLRGGLSDVLHRDWPGVWRFVERKEATLRGLGLMIPRER